MTKAVFYILNCITPSKTSGLLDWLFTLAKFPCFCGTYIFPPHAFVIFLALLGVIVTLAQISCVLVDGETLSDRFLPLRPETETPLKETTVRDFKLVLTVLELAIYVCLMAGSYLHSSMLLMPWLLNKLILVTVTMLLTFFKFFTQKPMTLSTLRIISYLTEIHNYLYVLCLFHEIVKHSGESV
ncbi:uncharacterized protein LOC128988581 [Macrosteles quadrilineatus]|uniref:uncharacterized protein LOC128988581 n=1 Tax=Macrosteles quadrilineatus TaxID=74068 RepID=UPI0023E2835B|nr:uncharacterized protein LOC128988581 [Macrosteles quadrilineatus]